MLFRSFSLHGDPGEFTSHLENGELIIDRADPVIRVTDAFLELLRHDSPFVIAAVTPLGEIFTIVASNRTVVYRLRGMEESAAYDGWILEWPD